MRGQYVLLLLLMFALACIFMPSVLLGAFGTSDHHGPDSLDNFPFQDEADQAGWRAEIYEFLNCDNCDSSSKVPCSSSANAAAPALDQTKGNETANYWLENSNKLYLAGYYEQAAASYSKALVLNSSLTEGWINMANSLYFLGRYQESLDAFNAVIASDPLNANAILGKGKVMMAINRTKEANTTIETTRT